MLKHEASSFQKHSKRKPISEPWAAFFMSFRVWVRLLPPSWHTRWPRSTKAYQNQPKSLLRHGQLVKNRPSKNMPQEVQSHSPAPSMPQECHANFHPLPCFCSGSSGLPRTTRNVADKSCLFFCFSRSKKNMGRR